MMLIVILIRFSKKIFFKQQRRKILLIDPLLITSTKGKSKRKSKVRKIIVTKNWQQLDIFCVVFTNEIYKYALIHLFTGTLNEL